MQCNIDADGTSLRRIPLGFIANQMVDDNQDLYNQHVCKVISGHCKCCDCDYAGKPKDIDAMGSGYFWLGEGKTLAPDKTIKTLAQCEHACSISSSCKTGTFVSSFAGDGQCWLAPKALVQPLKCMENCDSFMKVDTPDTSKSLMGWFNAFHVRVKGQVHHN